MAHRRGRVRRRDIQAEGKTDRRHRPLDADATGLDHGLANLDDLSDLLGAGTTWRSLWPSQLSLKGLPVSLGRVSVVTDLALSKTTVRLSIVSLTVEVDIGEREKPLCAVPGTTFTLKNIVATWQWLPQIP